MQQNPLGPDKADIRLAARPIFAQSLAPGTPIGRRRATSAVPPFLGRDRPDLLLSGFWPQGTDRPMQSIAMYCLSYAQDVANLTRIIGATWLALTDRGVSPTDRSGPEAVVQRHSPRAVVRRDFHWA